MAKLRRQNFLKGALIIAIAHLFVKGVGALFKIPLTRFILGPDGIGIYNASYTIYNALFIISTAGLPVAISKMVSESIARGNYYEANKIFRISKILLFLLGVIGAAILFFGAEMFAGYLKVSSANMAIMAMAPSLFFVSIMSAYRGYFQGMSNMIPTAASEAIEASGKLFIGLVLAYMFLPMGKEYAATGAILGVSTGTFLGAAFLFVYYQKVKKSVNAQITNKTELMRVTPKAKTILAKMVKLAVPITMGASVFTLASVIDLAMILRQLESLGFDETARTTMYGYYSGYAVTMFNVPPTIIASLSVSIVPAIAAALVKKDILKARKTTETALRMTFLFALPCAIGMSVLSAPILNLLFNDTGAATLLSILSYGILFVSIVMVSNSVIQSTGRVWIPVVHMCIGGAVKVLVNYVLVGNIDININGAPVGTVLCYLVTAMLNLISIHKHLHPSYGVGFVVKSILSAAIMGFLADFLYKYTIVHTGSNFISLMFTVVVAAGVYLLLILLTRAVNRQDLESMPGSQRFLPYLERFFKIK